MPARRSQLAPRHQYRAWGLQPPAARASGPGSRAAEALCVVLVPVCGWPTACLQCRWLGWLPGPPARAARPAATRYCWLAVVRRPTTPATYGGRAGHGSLAGGGRRRPVPPGRGVPRP